jgi:prepilin-type processing-associated H-X9-DG protein
MKNLTQTNTGKSAFTRLDLLAMIAVLGLGALVALPSLAAIAHDANADLCQNNQKQIMRALHLYAADNGDYLPYNVDDSGPSEWISAKATGPDSTNRAKLFDPKYNMIANYLDPANNVFRCPADTSVYTNGTSIVPKVRSVSMNQAVGTQWNSPGRRPVDGPWLDGNHSHIANSVWRCYGRLADVVNPRPAGLFILLDEDPQSINDASYAGIGPARPGVAQTFRWLDLPAKYHDNGASFAFADGHSETRKWLSLPGTMTPASAPGTNDLLWIADHTSALIVDQP